MARHDAIEEKKSPSKTGKLVEFESKSRQKRPKPPFADSSYVTGEVLTLLGGETTAA
jgi:hypothetical protein